MSKNLHSPESSLGDQLVNRATSYPPRRSSGLGGLWNAVEVVFFSSRFLTPHWSPFQLLKLDGFDFRGKFFEDIHDRFCQFEGLFRWSPAIENSCEVALLEDLPLFTVL